MKLTRHELICATDKQLAVIGFTRKQNSGWLRNALSADFTSREIGEFYHADTRKKKNSKDSIGLMERADRIQAFNSYTNATLDILLALAKILEPNAKP